MTNTNHHAWLNGVSVEIKKGNFDVKIGPKAETKAVQVVTPPKTAPVHHMSSQDATFLVVFVIFLTVTTYYGVKRFL